MTKEVEDGCCDIVISSVGIGLVKIRSRACHTFGVRGGFIGKMTVIVGPLSC